MMPETRGHADAQVPPPPPAGRKSAPTTRSDVHDRLVCRCRIRGRKLVSKRGQPDAEKGARQPADFLRTSRSPTSQGRAVWQTATATRTACVRGRQRGADADGRTASSAVQRLRWGWDGSRWRPRLLGMPSPWARTHARRWREGQEGCRAKKRATAPGGFVGEGENMSERRKAGSG